MFIARVEPSLSRREIVINGRVIEVNAIGTGEFTRYSG